VATFLFVLVFAWNEYLIALFLTNARAQTLPLTWQPKMQRAARSGGTCRC